MKRLFRSIRSEVQRIRNGLMEHAYWVTLAAGALIVVASGIAARDSEVQAAARAPEIEQTPVPTPTLMPLATIAPLDIAEVRHGGTTVWPVSGDLLRGYEATEPVLWEALLCLKTHPAVDLAAAVGEDALAMMDGTVLSCARDELWGWHVKVCQTDGSQAVYRGLEGLYISEGQSITRSQPLGLLMEVIPCEAELGAHLHLETSRDGEWIDPLSLLPKK